MIRLAPNCRLVGALMVCSAAACSSSDLAPIDVSHGTTGGLPGSVAAGGHSANSAVGSTSNVGQGGSGGTNGGTGGTATVSGGGNGKGGQGGTTTVATGGGTSPSGGIGNAATGGAGNGGLGGTTAVATGGTGKGGTTAATGGTGRGGAGGTAGLATGGGKGGIGGTAGATVKGGANAGGAATGGSATGGSAGSCVATFAEPPSNVAAWVNESWNSQLGDNIRSRKAWLLDSAMLGNGQINLCVRWGATTAPSDAVKTGMAAAVQKWFNDWFSQLQGYGCFPLPTITAKVTGWAVRPANTAWVSDLGSDVKIYTETDADGEPKCADSCSFFSNWTHAFPNCPGGSAFHHDYWLWLDDTIGGGAAAVGGDWGLRMPVSNFINAMNKSNLVIEHEMGHGFGFQDYYTWTGSTPTGGSLMIVGSTNSQTPTIADTWLLRRTWKEMKTLRGW